MNEKWFAMSIEEIEKKLKTNAASGLSLKAAASRCSDKSKGAPFFSVKKRKWNKLLLDFLSDFFLIMLLLVAIFSLLFEGDAIIGGATLVLAVTNICLSYFLYYRDTRSSESASDFFMPTARVIRGGKLYICDYSNVVVGDVILVEKGDVLGCDARLVQSDSLCVSVKLNKGEETTAQKFANGTLDGGELRAENMVNMLHAGSAIKQGSGRAIVVATGEYTYLGAITGGMVEVPSTKLPDGLALLKKRFSHIGIILLLLTLPFCIFSLMFGNFTGRTVLLSEALLIALSLGATAMLSRTTNLFMSFFAVFTRRAALADNPCIIRSLSSFDRLGDADCLFILDGSIATDGIFHFDSIVSLDGESNRLDSLSQNGLRMRDAVSVYALAKSGALSEAGLGAVNSLDNGIYEFIKNSKADLEAQKIRCKIHSFIPGADRDGSDIVDFSENGARKTLCVCANRAVIDNCTSAFFGSVEKTLTDEGRAAAVKAFDSCVARGKRPVVFIQKDANGSCLIGMLVLSEGVDPAFENAVEALRKSGVKIISFSNCVGRGNIPEIPELLRRGERIYAGDLIKKGLPISHNFGAYDEYCGFNDTMISDLARYVKSQGKTLAVLGFSDYAAGAIECADVFITCAPIKAESAGRISEEIRSLEIPGEQSSASCTQDVKQRADVLLMRPMGNKGGLEPLSRAIDSCKSAYRNLRNYVYYIFVAQMMRIICIALPMLFGNSVADVRQVMYLGFIFDFFAMLVFMSDMRKTAEDRKKLRKTAKTLGFADIFKSNKKITICALVGSAAAVILPETFESIGIFGKFYYSAEFYFVALVLLQALLLVGIYAKDFRNKGALLRLINNLYAQICAGVTVLFTLLCFITPIGRFFGVIESQISYFLLAFVPAIAFFVCFVAMTSAESKKKGQKKTRKL